ILSFVFFFQAEDGIRDRNVTGVQTCALPICGLMFNGGRHYGIDFGMPTGTSIKALTDGKITQAGPVSGGGGNQVTLQEPGGKWFQWYMHMSKILTKKGARVKA